MSNKAKASPSASSRLCMGNPLLNKNANEFKFRQEEEAISSCLPQMLKELFPFRVKVCRNQIEDFFKLGKKDRKEALKKEAMRLRETLTEPKMGHLKKHVCVGLSQSLRLLQRGELCLLILDQDHQTGLESVLATARASNDCAIMTVEGLGENICKGAIGYPSSAIGFKRSIADVTEFEEAANIARRVNSMSLSSENTRESGTRPNAEVADHDHIKDVSSGEVKNVLLKRKDRADRIFHPPTARTLAEKGDAGQGFISLQTDECKISSKKRKWDSDVKFEKTKLIVVPAGKKKKKEP